MTISIEAFKYRTKTPKGYECSHCHVTGVKLWREYQTFLDHQQLLCATCAPIVKPREAAAQAEFRRKYSIVTDQLCDMVPAIPTEDGTTFWGYSSVPQDGVEWWKTLPEKPT